MVKSWSSTLSRCSVFVLRDLVTSGGFFVKELQQEGRCLVCNRLKDQQGTMDNGQQHTTQGELQTHLVKRFFGRILNSPASDASCWDNSCNYITESMHKPPLHCWNLNTVKAKAKWLLYHLLYLKSVGCQM